jgi:hypothetical protein
MNEPCDHKYVHYDTTKQKDDRHFGVTTWKRVDFFFCEKCLDEQRKEKTDNTWERPDWY